jgi:hypothetical protein
MTNQKDKKDLQEEKNNIDLVFKETKKRIVGQERFIRNIIVAILC